MFPNKTYAIAALVLSVLAGTLSAAEGNPRKMIFSEDFEGDGRMRPWASNGPFKVNFAGPTEDQAAGGRRSFKIDVTWTDCTYNYWQAAPLRIPYYGNLRMRGKLYIERGNAEFGYSNANPEAETAGNVARGEKTKTLPNGWTEWASTINAPRSSAQYVMSLVVYLRPDKEGRSVVYVDDLEIEASLPEDYESVLKSRIAEIAARRRVIVLEQTGKLQAEYELLTGKMDKLNSAFPASVSGALAACWQKRCECCRGVRAELDGRLKQLQNAPTTGNLNSARRLLASLQRDHDFSVSLTKHAEANSKLPHVVWIIDPISDHKVLPGVFPLPGVLGTKLRVSACRGEYEPASFAIHASKELRNVIAHVSDAKCEKSIIPASAIDIRIVKCWWQAGVGIGDMRHPTFTPELLLKDADLVRVDNQKKRNVLRNPQAPRDAKQLQPVSIPAGATQQFWVTVHVPDDARPGTYHGTIRLDAAEMPTMDLSLEIEVLPFSLKQSPLQYSIYYRGRLTPDGKGSISSEAKSEAQYLAEMRDLKAHGVMYPTCYQSLGDLLDREIHLRKQAGIAVDPFYSLGAGTGAPSSAEAIEALKGRVRSWRAHLAKHGIKELYVYGIDEASGARLKAERQAFQAVHEAGAKVFVACYAGSFELVGDLLDLAIYAGRLLPDEAEKWHGAGHRIFSYAHPQVGVEQPETYRRNFGLALWKAGYDGACNYAYQHGFGDVWDDFDSRSYRDHNFSYPTVDGVIDTIQWEGFREGVDDVRYVATLLAVIERAKADSARRQLAEETRQWLQSIDPNGDLDTLRAEIIKRIICLKRKAES